MPLSPLLPCGTRAGYNRHRKAGEDACGACKTALALYKREAYAAGRGHRPRPARKVFPPRRCRHCEVEFVPTVANKVFCSPECRWPGREPKRVASAGPRSKGRTGRPWRRMRERVLSEEPDCWLCDQPIDRSVPFPNRGSASVDHVVRIRDGGSPLDRANLRAAHLGCNLDRERVARSGLSRFEELRVRLVAA